MWLPNLFALFVTVGFLFAYGVRASYGGSMVHTDGSERTLLGLSIGVVGFGLVIALSMVSLALQARPDASRQFSSSVK